MAGTKIGVSGHATVVKPDSISENCVPQKVLDAADKHNDLFTRLLKIQHAPTTLEYEERYIQDLKKQIASREPELQQLRISNPTEGKRCEKVRTSIVSRFAHKFARRSKDFEFNLETKEREYLKVQSRKEALECRIKWFEDAIDTAKRRISIVTPLATEYKKLKAELDQLHQDVFDGLADEYPEEERVKSAVIYNEDWYRTAQLQESVDRHALVAMNGAIVKIIIALKHCETAQRTSFGEFFGAKTIRQIIKRNSLSKAQAKLLEAHILLAQASRTQPGIRSFASDVHTIISGHALMDITFGKSASDTGCQQEVDNMATQIKSLEKEIRAEAKKQKDRYEAARKTVGEAATALEETRRELEILRAEIFEKISGKSCEQPSPDFEDDAPPPPPPTPYSEISLDSQLELVP
ncbi:hypothetical protein TWF696_004296 [Orbilia brochopaga]|uniref:Uncharacterized protein n=1 Tax=Orbilia brochopaga TaxID=3140254 RepID=A0AAV9V7E8_9PEZI